MFKNTEGKTYNIPIEHVPSQSKSNNSSSSFMSDNNIDNSINELLALKDSSLDVFNKTSLLIF